MKNKNLTWKILVSITLVCWVLSILAFKSIFGSILGMTTVVIGFLAVIDIIRSISGTPKETSLKVGKEMGTMALLSFVLMLIPTVLSVRISANLIALIFLLLGVGSLALQSRGKKVL